MRDQRFRQTRSRRTRRVTLLLLILSAAPAATEEPSGHSLRLMPPLPLKSITLDTACGEQDCSVSPFCDSGALNSKPPLLALPHQECLDQKYPNQECPDQECLAQECPDQACQLDEGWQVAPSLELPEIAEAVPISPPTISTPAPLEHAVPAEPRLSTITLVRPARKLTQPSQSTTEPATTPTPVDANIALPMPVAETKTGHLTPTAPEGVEVDLGIAPTNTPTQAEPIFYSFSDQPPASVDTTESEPDAGAAEPIAVIIAEPIAIDEPVAIEEPVAIDEPTSKDGLTVLDEPTSTDGPVALGELASDDASSVASTSPQQTQLQALPTFDTNTSSETTAPSTLTEAYPDDSVAASLEPLKVGEAAPIAFDANAVEPVPPKEPKVEATTPSPKIYRGQRSVIVAEKSSESPSLHTQRFRPPVAVTPVPSGFVRGADADAVAPSDSSQPSALVQQAEKSPEIIAEPSSNEQDPTFANRHSIVDAGVKLTPLYMKSAQVRSLTVAGQLQDIQVADSSVCRAVAVGPNQLKLIGTGNGITQLVVWAKTDEPNQPVKMRAFEVHVDRVDPAVAAGGSTSQLLQQSIRDAFPLCQVELLPEGGHLIVRGRCDSPQSAEKIIRMIRKTCNVPVNDQLIVR